MEYFLRDLLVALARRGIEVGALVHHHKPGLPSSFEIIDRVFVWRSKILGHLGFIPLSPAFLKSFLECINNWKPDILHFHLPNASAFWGLGICRAKKIPWVIHWHADVVSSNFSKILKFSYPIYAIPERLFLKRADVVIASSPDYLNSSKPLNDFHNKCTVVPLGIDTDRMPYPSSSLLQWAEQTWGNTSFRVLSAGRLSYYKGFDVLIKAIGLLPEDVSLHIAGTGYLENPLKKLARQLGLQNRVVFHGYLSPEQLTALFLSSHCFVLSSIERTEAFGIVLLEAMFHEKPIIASNLKGSGMSWIVKNARCGLLFEPGNIHDCAEKILWLKNNPRKAIKYGEAGKTFLLDNLLIDRVAKKIAFIYQGLL
ncbi:MAG: glycosyltransferase [Thermodesulforhabdaceae bacterium]